MTFDFSNGNFVVYESKTVKGYDEVEKVKYFKDLDKASQYYNKCMNEEVMEAPTICGYEYS